MLLIILVFSFIYCRAMELTQVVNTSKGLVQGKILKTVGKELEYSVYFGIPFAKPPVGSLRFKPPEEADPWSGVLDATKEPNHCPQKSYWKNNSYEGDEDCLYLNVYTPKINSSDTKKRAVMVWIYAGGFVFGSNSPEMYGPDFLIEEDVVVVMPNHRVGALGFLSLNHKNATGNAGLKDLVFALKWVQEDIENFGGDSKRVTIFGDSSGAAAVGYLVLSDLSAGLFHGAISMSGSPLNIWAYEPIFIAQFRAFVTGFYLGIHTLDKSHLLEQLHSKSAEEIVAVTKSLLNLETVSFAPTWEDPEIATMPLITKCALQKYKSGDFNQVPQIMGFVEFEFLYYVSKGIDGLSMIKLLFDDLFDLPLLRQLKNINQITNLTNWIVGKLYRMVHTIKYRLTNIISDLLLIYDIDRTQRHLTVASSAPVYYYRNSFDHPQAKHRQMGVDLDGAAHVDDVYQIFWSSIPQSIPPKSESRFDTHRQRMVKMWTNFAKYRNPTPNGTMDPLLNITWPPSNDDGRHLEINTNFSVGLRPVDVLVDVLQTILNPLHDLFGGCV